jgi:hypothetical protein
MYIIILYHIYITNIMPICGKLYAIFRLDFIIKKLLEIIFRACCLCFGFAQSITGIFEIISKTLRNRAQRKVQ